MHLFPLSGSGQEDELGHEENLFTMEGPGPGGDQHRCSLQLPGSSGQGVGTEGQEQEAQWECENFFQQGTPTSTYHLFTSCIRMMAY